MNIRTSAFLSVVILVLSTIHIHAQSVGMQWAQACGGSQEDGGTRIATDASGNVYTIGTYKGTADLDPGPSVYSLGSSGNQDVFILKCDSNGHFIWAKKIGGPHNEYANGICISASGHLYITGFFSGTVDFNPGAGINTMSTGGVSDNDVYVVKLDTAGNYIWSKQMGGSLADYGYGVTLDPLNQLVLCGSFKGTADFNPGTAVYNLNAAGNSDIYVCKLDTAGNFIWAAALGGTGIDYAFSVSTDASANIYTTGTYSGTGDFDPGPANYPLMVYGGPSDEDVFVSKLDVNGNFSWAKSIGGANYDQGAAILIRNAAVYVTGSFWGSADFDPGPALHYLFASSADDIFLLSLDTAGNYQWAFNYGSTGFNSGSSLGVNAGGDIYCSGYFNGTVDFDPSASISALTSAGSTDVFIICNDSNGVFKWARNFGGNNDEEGYMQVQLNGSIYVTGSFGGSADFDPSGSVYALTATGLTDLYQLKLAPCFSSSSNSSVSACDSYSWNGNTYTTTGNYVQYLTNATGCDSLLQLQLTIHNNNNSLLNLSVCDSMVLNGNTYTLSGNYIQYYTNSYGCDSNIYLGLQVNYSSSSTQNITACDTYNWNGNNYTLTGSYIQTISNTTGCDSTMLLNLVIHPNSSSSQAVTSCSTYQWNGNNYSVSGTYLDTLVNVAGCDSLMSLQLNIPVFNTNVNQSGSNLQALGAATSYQWVWCPSYTPIVAATNALYVAFANGDYACILTQNGCSDTTACYTVSGLSLNETTGYGVLNLYPNPVTNRLYVDLAGSSFPDTWMIYNLHGELIQKEQITNTKRWVIDLSDRTPGVYMLKIQSSDGVWVQPFLKE